MVIHSERFREWDRITRSLHIRRWKLNPVETVEIIQQLHIKCIQNIYIYMFYYIYNNSINELSYLQEICKGDYNREVCWPIWSGRIFPLGAEDPIWLTVFDPAKTSRGRLIYEGLRHTVLSECHFRVETIVASLSVFLSIISTESTSSLLKNKNHWLYQCHSINACEHAEISRKHGSNHQTLLKVEEIEIVMPNQHYITIDMTKIGLVNKDEVSQNSATTTTTTTLQTAKQPW